MDEEITAGYCFTCECITSLCINDTSQLPSPIPLSPVSREGELMPQLPKSEFTKDRVERVARMYNSTGAAANALGINPGSFNRLCRKYGIDTPKQRRDKEKRARAADRREENEP